MNEDVEKIIIENRKLVFWQLNKFGLAKDQEAESIAYEALYNAATTYDGSVKFTTYATVCIYNALGSYTRTLLRVRQLEVVSYHAHTGEHSELLGTLAASQDTAEEYLKAELLAEIKAVFNRLYARVTNVKHQAIVKAWQDSDFEMSATDIAKEVGVSQSYVSQVLSSFKNKLRVSMEGYIEGNS